MDLKHGYLVLSVSNTIVPLQVRLGLQYLSTECNQINSGKFTDFIHWSYWCKFFADVVFSIEMSLIST